MSSRLELESLSREVVGLENVTEHGRDPNVHAICDRDFDSGSCAGSIPTQFDALVSTNSLVFSTTQPVLAGIDLLCKILIMNVYFRCQFGLLTNLLVQLLLSSHELCDAMRCRRE